MINTICFALLLSSTAAFAAEPIVGQWYVPAMNSGRNFTPESLLEIDASGVMTMNRLMPNRTQKMVTKTQMQLANDGLTMVTELSATKCTGLTDIPMPQGLKLDYQIRGDRLAMMGGQLSMTKASEAQIQKFNQIGEGCN